MADTGNQDVQQRPDRFRRGSRIAGLTMRAVLAAGALPCLAACTQHPNYRAVCEDAHTGKRVPDQVCQHSRPTRADTQYWVYFRSGQDAPAIGSAVSGGTRTPPVGDDISQGGVSPGGGPIEEDTNGGGSGTGGSGTEFGNSGGADNGGDSSGSESGGGESGGGESGGGEGGGGEGGGGEGGGGGGGGGE